MIDATYVSQFDTFITAAPSPIIDDVGSALGILGSDGFLHAFGVKPPFARKLAALMLGTAAINSTHKHGHIFAEEALLLVLARLRSTVSTVSSLARLFGRPNTEGRTTDFLNVTARALHRKFNHLVKLQHLHRFAPYADAWEQMVVQKYSDLVGYDVDTLPLRFSCVNSFADGYRLDVARLIAGQEAFYSGFTCGHSIVFTAVSEPGGILLGLSAGYEGRHNDFSVAKRSSLASHLQFAGLKCLADKGYKNSVAVASLPRANQEHGFFVQELTALSAIRTAGIEWPFGMFQQTFPYFTQKGKQKTLQTMPELWLIVGVILSNCIRLQDGCNNNTYFKCEPFISMEEYLNWEP